MTQHAPGPTRDPSTYIGGSKIAALMGVNPFADSYDVYRWIVHKEEIHETYEMAVGNIVEREVLERVGKELNLTFEYPGTLVVPKYEFLGATPDAVEYTSTLQMKSMGPQRYMSPVWGPGGSGYVPTEVYYQANWEAGVFHDYYGREPVFCRVLAWCRDWRMHVCEYDRDLYELCKQTAIDFWHNHVMPRIAPERQVREDVADWRDDEGYAPLVERYLELRAEVKALREEQDDVAASLRRIATFGPLSTSVGTVRLLESKGRVNWNALAHDLKANGFLTDNTINTYRGEPGSRIDVREAK